MTLNADLKKYKQTVKHDELRSERVSALFF